MATQNSNIDTKFDQHQLMQEALRYIEKTYDQHYKGKVQPTELIASADLGHGFCLGNIIKYASRFGKKDRVIDSTGQFQNNQKDLFKIIHYAIILLHIEKQNKVKSLHETV